MNKTDLEKILEERGSMYGPFSTHAKITQDLKAVMHNTPQWKSLPNDVKEALEMIQHKIARILNGRHQVKDSWDDISGYAQCVTRNLPDL